MSRSERERFCGPICHLKKAMSKPGPIRAAIAPKWKLVPSEIEAVTQPIAPRQRFEKTWELRHDDVAGLLPLVRKIAVACPGFTFVSVHNDRPLVRATAEAKEVLDAIAVEMESSGRLQLRSKSSLEQKYLLIEVAVPAPFAVKHLQCRGSGSVIVEDQVVITDQPGENLSIEVTGHAALFLTSQSEIHTKSFKAVLMGSGNIEIYAAGIVLESKFEAVVASTGKLHVFAGDLHADKMEMNIASSGELQIAAYNYKDIKNLEGNLCGSGTLRIIGDTLQVGRCQVSAAGSGEGMLAMRDSMEADQLECMITGSARWDFGCPKGSSNQETIAIKGSGMINVQDVVTKISSVEMRGNCSATVRATDEVKARCCGTSDITVVGNPPRRTRGDVQFAPLGPCRVDHLMSTQSYPSNPPLRTDAFAYSIEESSMSTAVMGVVRDMWKDFTSKPEKKAPVAIAVPCADPLPCSEIPSAVAIAVPASAPAPAPTSVAVAVSVPEPKDIPTDGENEMIPGKVLE